MSHIVLHGTLASVFAPGLAAAFPGAVTVLPQDLDDAGRTAYAAADILVAVSFSTAMPRPQKLILLHLPNAGTDRIDFDALPDGAVVCNSFGHGAAIAEYVMAALLARTVPLAEADRHLKTGDWRYRADPVSPVRRELAGATIGILGFGHIGQAVAARAKAFEMQVHVANRSPVAPSPAVDRNFGLNDLTSFLPSLDYLVCCLPLTPQTEGLVDARAFAAMRPACVVVNVGRGATIDEHALFAALREGKIAGAAIDTWYRYPTAEQPQVFPSALPFHELPNVTMTPHMAAWTEGMLARRLAVMTDNICRRLAGAPCRNVVWPR